jgi:hypothetical protein
LKEQQKQDTREIFPIKMEAQSAMVSALWAFFIHSGIL